MCKDKKKMLQIGGSILISVLVIGVSFLLRNDKEYTEETHTQNEETQQQEEKQTTEAAVPVQRKQVQQKVNTPTAISQKISNNNIVQPQVQIVSGNLKQDEAAYAKALISYENWRMQINACNALPIGFTVKSGNSILLDGMSDMVQRLSFNGIPVTLSRHDARIIKLTSSEITTVSIDCSAGGNDRHNVATITIMP